MRRLPPISTRTDTLFPCTARFRAERTGGTFTVFNGRGGLELTDNLRLGCAGLIPAPECFDVQVRVWELMREGRDAEAESLYREILPLRSEEHTSELQ